MRTRHFIVALCLLMVATPGCGAGAGSTTPTPPPTLPLATRRPTLTPQPTPTLPPITLPPPRIPTPSATPVTYIVEEGDTPIVIANKFGVSVADLIALNGIDPSTLQIGKVLIIPVGQPNGPQGNNLLPTPSPAAYVIRGLNTARTPAGSLEVLGEVYNPGPNALSSVQIQVTLLDDAGAALVTAPIWVVQELVRPEQAAPFRALFTDPPAAYSRVSVDPLRGEPVDPAQRFANLQVTRSEGQAIETRFRVTGEVTNADTVSASKALLVVTTYDPDGKVIGFRQQILSDGPVAPNAVLPFNLTFASNSPNVAKFAVTVEGVK